MERGDEVKQSYFPSSYCAALSFSNLIAVKWRQRNRKHIHVKRNNAEGEMVSSLNKQGPGEERHEIIKGKGS